MCCSLFFSFCRLLLMQHWRAGTARARVEKDSGRGCNGPRRWVHFFFFFFFYGLRPCAPLPPTILVMPDLRLFARRHHLAKPSAMQLKGWETAAPPLGSPRGRRDKSGTGMLASSSPADDLIPELPAGAPSRGVYVRVPFASERTPLREFLWGLAAGTAELGAVLRAPFAGVRRRTLADKLPLWGAAVGDPEGCVTLPPEQARVVAVRRAEAVEARAAAAAAQAAGKKKKGKGGGGGGVGGGPPSTPLPPPLPRRPRLNAGFPSPGVRVVILSNIAVVWGVLHANPPF